MIHKKIIYLLLLLSFFSLPAATQEGKTKRAIVIGATSGMGRAVAKLLAKDGYTMGLAGRRVHLLQSLQKEIGTPSYIKQIDVSQHKKAREQLLELIDSMGGMDLILISVSAWDETQEQHTWQAEKAKLEVDLMGFWAMAHPAIAYFEKQQAGHLVAISSLSGLRGSAHCPAYCGAKSFISTYLEGVRNKMIQNNIPIYITDIIPSWVDVEHTTYSEQPGTYWVTPLDKAAKQIFNAIKTKKKFAYISRRQILIALLLNIMPDWLFNWIGEL